MTTKVHRYLRKERIEAVQYTCRIHKSLFDLIEEKAITQNVSINSIVNRALKAGVKRIQ
jgi:predicted HicB family RNase H-like nuclease